jgi:hypothetical protein
MDAKSRGEGGGAQKWGKHVHGVLNYALGMTGMTSVTCKHKSVMRDMRDMSRHARKREVLQVESILAGTNRQGVQAHVPLGVGENRSCTKNPTSGNDNSTHG